MPATELESMWPRSLFGVARSLTRLVKLDLHAQFRQASALDLPFEPGTFDGAYMIHVGMNIADKAGVFREVARVLKRGGRFAIFDVMIRGNGALQFPLPWATDPATSFVASAADYRHALETAAFASITIASGGDLASNSPRQ